MMDYNGAITSITVLISMLVPYIGSMLQFLVVFAIAICRYNGLSSNGKKLLYLIIPLSMTICGLAIYMAITYPTDLLSMETLSVDEPAIISFVVCWIIQFVALLAYLVFFCMLSGTSELTSGLGKQG